MVVATGVSCGGGPACAYIRQLFAFETQTDYDFTLKTPGNLRHLKARSDILAGLYDKPAVQRVAEF